MNKLAPTTKFIEVTPSSWEEAKKLGRILYRTCAFRGMENKEWILKTSIERAAERFNCPTSEIWYREKEILRIFKARAHHYIQSPPEDENNIEWLSLIQHHGGPTRLLDFTESFYVAAFFAVQNTENDACVWAINRALLAGKLMNLGLSNFTIDKKYSLYAKEITDLSETFVSDETKKEALILAIQPPRLNERLAVQKGLFLFPCDIENSFVSNLCKAFNLPFTSLESKNAEEMMVSDINEMHSHWSPIWKINLSREIHTQILVDLYSMNIDAASLFPGLDGFATSLNNSIRWAEPSMQRVSSITIYPTQPQPKVNPPKG